MNRQTPTLTESEALAEEQADELEALMQEPPVELPPQRIGDIYESDSGWQIIETLSGEHGADMGMSAHRNTLSPEDYVDMEVLQELFENQLGMCLTEFETAYSPGHPGRPSAERLELRRRLDPIILELVDGGVNIERLATVLGVHKETLYLAASRARAAR